MRRMNIYIITGIVIILAGGIFFILKKLYNKSLTESLMTDTVNKEYLPIDEAEKIVLELEKAGYYKYTDSIDLDTLKKVSISSIAEYGILSTEYNVRTLLPLDNRLFMFDGEAVFEQNGFIDAIKDMQSLFDKMNFKIEITDHIEEFDQEKDWLNHRMIINGKPYIVFENFEGYGWGEAAQRFAEIINDQLEIQQKDERIYLINGGNDGTCVFLTHVQFGILDNVLNDKQSKPLKVEDWCSVFQVNPKAYIRNGK